jgi:hypothetical protein
MWSNTIEFPLGFPTLLLLSLVYVWIRDDDNVHGTLFLQQNISQELLFAFVP